MLACLISHRDNSFFAFDLCGYDYKLYQLKFMMSRFENIIWLTQNCSVFPDPQLEYIADDDVIAWVHGTLLYWSMQLLLQEIRD